MLKHLLCAATVVAASTSLTAQSCQNLGTSLGNGDDVVFAIQPIGFAFPLGGTTYTDVHAGVPAPGGADYSSTQAEFASDSPRVAPAWTDFNMLAANGADVLIENTTGNVCRITWLNAQPYLGYNIQGETFTVQCELFPNGDAIFYYGNLQNVSTSNGGANMITGITPGGGVTLPAPVDLITPGASTDTTVFEEWATAGTFDIAVNSLQLVATSPGYAYVTNGVMTDCASIEVLGSGCNEASNAVHEFFDDGAWDLGTNTITLIRGTSDYSILDAVPGTFVPPTAGATVIANADDTVQTVTLSSPVDSAAGPTTDLHVCSNGYLALGGTAPGADYTPTVDEFLAFDGTTIAAAWGDLDPTEAGSGKITFEEVGTIAYITWDDVYGQAETVGDTFQVQIDLSTGVITIVYVAHNTAGAYLVGYKGDGASTTGSAIDATADLTAGLTVPDLELLPLTLSGNDPVLGTDWDLVTTNIDPISPITATFFGSGAVGVPGGVPMTVVGIDAPGCFVHIDTILGDGSALSVGGTSTLTFPLPPTPALAGGTLSAQSVCLTLSNNSNLLTSNGVLGRIGF